MAKTPYSDLGSTDILSGHISGLQHSVNKMEGVLNMKTSNIAGHPLVAVADQDDPSMRYRIYEGTIRNWLDNPAPVIYRGGVVVPGTEYTAYPAYGVVVFNTQQAANAAITADVSYVMEGSATIDSINANTDNLLNMLPVSHTFAGYWRSANITAGVFGNTAASVDPNYLVALPLLVPQDTTVDAIGTYVVSAGLATSYARLGLYADDGTFYPGALLEDSGEFVLSTAGAKTTTFAVARTLTRGIYWLVSNVNDDNPGWQYHDWDTLLPLGIDGSLQGAMAVGLMAAQAYGPLPAAFPAGAAKKFPGGTVCPAVFVRPV